uniref:ras-related protein Rab-9A isoform X2 n=1 Tax=Macaca mulatta TaxID=9544 RepID=UPI0010A23FA0|nr:ras-related protein Rab-9A isoform X2 [Macaca mulatta]
MDIKTGGHSRSNRPKGKARFRPRLPRLHLPRAPLPGPPPRDPAFQAPPPGAPPCFSHRPAPARRHVVPSALDGSSWTWNLAAVPSLPPAVQVPDPLSVLIAPRRAGSELPARLPCGRETLLHSCNEPGTVMKHFSSVV